MHEPKQTIACSSAVLCGLYPSAEVPAANASINTGLNMQAIGRLYISAGAACCSAAAVIFWHKNEVLVIKKIKSLFR